MIAITGLIQNSKKEGKMGVSIFLNRGKPDILFPQKYFRVSVQISRYGEVHSPFMFTTREVAEWTKKQKDSWLSEKDKEHIVSEARKHFSA
jgi:hypothetical protein